MNLHLFEDKTGILNGTDGITLLTTPDVKGTLVLGKERFAINGKTILDPKATGNVACAFLSEDGISYDCGIVNVDTGKIKPIHRETEQTIALKGKVESLEKQVSLLTDALKEIKGKMEYSGMDFII